MRFFTKLKIFGIDTHDRDTVQITMTPCSPEDVSSAWKFTVENQNGKAVITEMYQWVPQSQLT